MTGTPIRVEKWEETYRGDHRERESHVTADSGLMQLQVEDYYSLKKPREESPRAFKGSGTLLTLDLKLLGSKSVRQSFSVI